jgi:hypothetical protein
MHLPSSGSEERKAKRNKEYSRDMAREDRISLWVLFLKCQTCLAQGLTVMIAALRNEGMSLKSQGPFNTENEVSISLFICCIVIELMCKIKILSLSNG